jgi:hypothetical protein
MTTMTQRNTFRIRNGRLGQHGFGVHGAIALVLVLGVLGGIGYVVWNRSETGTTPPSITVQPDLPVSIETKADLQQANRAVTNTAQQLDGSMDTSSLTANIKSFL